MAVLDETEGYTPSPAAVDVPAEGPDPSLDLHEGISDPGGGCDRWPKDLRLRNEATGELVSGRCKATNLCSYCRILGVVETAEMLALDALEWAPTFWMVLTARRHLTRRDTYRHLEQLRAAARRRWPAVEWFVQVEFQKRGALHLNLLIKGVPAEDGDQLRDVLTGAWCRRLRRAPERGCEGPVYIGATPAGQWLEALSSAEAVSRYLQKELTHGLKREQAPPIGWKGHRTSQTRGYFPLGAAVQRRRARESLALKHALWRGEQAGMAAIEAEAFARSEVERRASDVWVLSTDRGGRLSSTAHDRKRRALTGDRGDGRNGVRTMAARRVALAWKAIARADRRRGDQMRLFAVTASGVTGRSRVATVTPSAVGVKLWVSSRWTATGRCAT